MKKTLTSIVAVLSLGTVMMAPSIASAQSYHRQSQKDTWKGLAIGAGAVGLIGALTHNDTLTAIGAAGALYSAYRYDADGNCYGRTYDRDHKRYEWVRVPDRDRNRGRDRNDWNWSRDRDDWNRGRGNVRNRNDWNQGRDSRDRGHQNDSRDHGRGR